MDVGSPLLDGYIDWLRKVFLCYWLRFEPMGFYTQKKFLIDYVADQRLRIIQGLNHQFD